MGNPNGLLRNDGLVFWHEGLHDDPTDEISHGAEAEHHHVGGWLAVVTQELEGCPLSFGVGEQVAGNLVDEHRSQTSRHSADARDGGDGRLREHVAYCREDIGAPSLMTGSSQTDDDGGLPSRIDG